MVPPPTAISPGPSPPTMTFATAAAATTASAAARTAGAGSHAGHPGQREVLHVRLIDLRQRAVALAGVVAVVGRPGVLERLEELGRSDSAALSHQEGRRQQKRRGQ